jgi:hypothetical protein
MAPSALTAAAGRPILLTVWEGKATGSDDVTITAIPDAADHPPMPYAG